MPTSKQIQLITEALGLVADMRRLALKAMQTHGNSADPCERVEANSYAAAFTYSANRLDVLIAKYLVTDELSE